MFTLKPITKEEIKNVQYKHDYKSDSYVVYQNGYIVAYLWLNLKDNNTLWLDMIEVIEKEKGLGTKIVKWLFECFAINAIEGLILKEERSYYFWESLGADIYYIHTEGYTVDECIECRFESPFVLTI